MIRENDINKFVNGRQFIILTAVLFVIASIVAHFKGVSHAQVLGEGAHKSFMLESMPVVSLLLNVVEVIGACVLLSFLNKTFTFIREVTYVFASSLLLLSIANPYTITQLNEGTVLSVVLVVVTGIVFGFYQDFYSQRKVYITFVILMTCGMLYPVFYYLLPVVLIGFMQMRVMSLRSVFAMLFGIATPLWISLGLGLLTIDEIAVPHVVTPWSSMVVTYSVYEIMLAVITSFVLVVLIGVNVLRIISYKMQVRAYNGFFLILSLFTMVMMVLHYDNMLTYLPILNMCLAVQIAHTFTINNYLRRYIPYLLFAVACLGLWVWQVMC